MIDNKTDIVKETKKLLEEVSVEVMSGFKEITRSIFSSKKK